MDFTFVLPGKLACVGLLAGVTAFAGLLLFAALNHYLIRALTDTRYRRPAPNLELLRRASDYLPNSARLNLALGQTELTGSPNPQQAIQHAALAVELSPADFQGWYLLGLAQDAASNQEQAEQAFAQAVKLAPTNSKVNWAAANVFLRGGRLDETITTMRTATAGDDSLLPTALELLWQASGRDLNVMQRLTAGRAGDQFALAQFFAEQSLFTEAVAAFQSLDRQQRLSDPRGAAFITQLLNAKQFPAAHALWLELVNQPSSTDGRAWLSNGGFEAEPPRNFGHFDWKLGETAHARISLDRSQFHSGVKSLKVLFTGRDTTTLNGEIEQLLMLRPGANYQLECFAKSLDLVTPEGPQIALFHAGTLLAATEPVAAGTTGWQLRAVSFTAPASSEPVTVRIVRRPKYVYDDPTKGTVWFDDFKLSCTGGC